MAIKIQAFEPAADFDKINFRKHTAKDIFEYDKGRIAAINYIRKIEPFDLIVRVEYTDVLGDVVIHGVTVPDRLIGINKKRIYYNDDNTVAFDFTELDRRFDRGSRKVELIKRKERNLENILGIAEDIGIVDEVKILKSHYKREIEEYIKDESLNFIKAIRNEENSDIIEILAIKLPYQTGTITIKNYLLYSL